MSKYGLPYMGSKSKICEQVCRLFPRADNFYDLFGGGFSITHFMLKHRSSHYKNFHFNELRPGICELIQKAINGDFSYDKYKPEWISRERFFSDLETDPMIKIIWSFGNNGENYLSSKDIEKEKKSMHMAVVFNEFDDYAKEVFGMDKFKDGFSITDKRLFLKNRIKILGKDRLDLQQLERLEQLERLQQLERLAFYSGSYADIKINKNSIVYCDIPYEGTADYGKDFDKKKFLNWAHELSEPVFISEYMVNDSRFKCIASIKKRSLLSASKDNNLIKDEKVFVNIAGYKKLISRK